MKLTVQLKEDDFFAFQKEVLRRAKKKATGITSSLPNFLVFAVLFLVIFILFILPKRFLPLHWPTLLGTLIAIFILALPLGAFYQRQLSKITGPAKDGVVLGIRRLDFTEEGIVEEAHNYKTQVPWETVREIVSVKDHIFIFIDNMAAFIIPKRDLSPDLTEEQFISGLKDFCRVI